MGKAARVAARKDRADLAARRAAHTLMSSTATPRPIVRVEVEAGYPEDWRVRLGVSADRVRRERQRQEVIVAQAIAAGGTWSAIAKQLGTSRQAAWTRFRHLSPTVKRSGVTSTV